MQGSVPSSKRRYFSLVRFEMLNRVIFRSGTMQSFYLPFNGPCASTSCIAAEIWLTTETKPSHLGKFIRRRSFGSFRCPYTSCEMAEKDTIIGPEPMSNECHYVFVHQMQRWFEPMKPSRLKSRVDKKCTVSHFDCGQWRPSNSFRPSSIIMLDHLSVNERQILLKHVHCWSSAQIIAVLSVQKYSRHQRGICTVCSCILISFSSGVCALFYRMNKCWDVLSAILQFQILLLKCWLSNLLSRKLTY
jgi:hypothetical protein